MLPSYCRHRFGGVAVGGGEADMQRRCRSRVAIPITAADRQALQRCQLQPHCAASVQQRRDDGLQILLPGHDLAHSLVKAAATS